jgi:hypothetical protein
MIKGTKESHCEAEEDELSLLQSGTQRHLMTKEHGRKDAMKFRVLDVGAPRTGTESMYAALQRLGYKPWHSGMNTSIRPSLCDYVFGSRLNSSFDKAMEMMSVDGYDAGMDEPFQLIYEEVMNRWPDSKFILSLRDPESWFQSYVELNEALTKRRLPDIANDFNISDLKDGDLQLLRAVHTVLENRDNQTSRGQCGNAKYWGCDFPGALLGNYTSKKECLARFQAHYDRVRQVIPSERLLEFNLSDGYNTLAPFLGKSIPTFPNGTIEPFPHVNTIEEGNTFPKTMEP